MRRATVMFLLNGVEVDAAMHLAVSWCMDASTRQACV